MHNNVTWERRADGALTLKVRVERGRGFFQRFAPPVMTKSYELDQFGSFVFERINSQRTVLELITAFEQQFRLSHREAELGVVAFLKMLMKREVISVVVP